MGAIDGSDHPTHGAVDVALSVIESRIIELSQRTMTADQSDRLARILYGGFAHAIRGMASMRGMRHASRAVGIPRGARPAPRGPGDAGE